MQINANICKIVLDYWRALRHYNYSKAIKPWRIKTMTEDEREEMQFGNKIMLCLIALMIAAFIIAPYLGISYEQDVALCKQQQAMSFDDCLYSVIR